MDSLLQLKIGIEALSAAEFIKFIESKNKQFWTNMVFEYFKKQLQDKNNINSITQIITDIDNMNNTVSNIITPKDNTIEYNDDDSKNQRFQDLPNVMIANIASFLSFDTVINLEKTCKSIFIATRQYFTLKYPILPITDNQIISQSLHRLQINIDSDTFISSINALNHWLLNGICSKKSDTLKISIKLSNYKPIKYDVSNYISMLLNNLNKHQFEFILLGELVKCSQINSVKALLLENEDRFNIETDIQPLRALMIPPKDKNAPKRPQSSYFIFVNQRKQEINEEQKNNMDSKEIMKLLSAEWKQMASNEKQIYQERATSMKIEYHMDVAKYRKTNNYKAFAKKIKKYRTTSIFFFAISNKDRVNNNQRQITEGLCDGYCYKPKWKP